MQESTRVLEGQSAGVGRADDKLFWPKFYRAILARLRTISIRRRVVSLRLQDSLALGDRRSLLVVQWEDRRYLLGLTPQSIQLIDRKLASEPSGSGRTDDEARRQ